ncbi:hypothetical protein [Desulfatibacillum aliphaticivorans]|uniref:hypothetical protein n=1 Tax=Desulfatibacillum aliphaticivorans TaxID=218208 RepID=UPI000405E9EE|nr:hypothetical protein [Desulfatibacillum aliphaticivorans]
MSQPLGQEEQGHDLDAMMTETRVIGTEQFNLAQCETEEGEPEAGGDEEKPLPEPRPEAPQEEGDGQGAPSDAGEQDQEPGEGAPKTRFKSHEEAEEGYRNLQAQATRTAQELADLKKAQAEEKAKQAAAESRKKKDAAVLEYSEQRHAETLRAIQAVDDEDPEEYDRKVAAIWAQNNLDVTNFAQSYQPEEASPPPESFQEDHQAGPSSEDVHAMVDTRIKEAGFDDHQKGVFYTFAAKAPVETPDGKPLSMGEQVQWAIDNTNNYFAGIEARIKAELKAAMEQPMGRGGQGKGAPGGGGEKSSSEPVSLSSALDAAMEKRRI